MSGIVGSRFNTRGSGLVGSLGTDGQVFTSSGAGTSANYEAAAGGGKILQCLGNTIGNSGASQNVTTQTPTATGLLQAITPTSATNRILIQMHFSFVNYDADEDQAGSGFELFRDIDGGGFATIDSGASGYIEGAGNEQWYLPAGGSVTIIYSKTEINYWDASYDSTAVVTYKLYIAEPQANDNYFNIGAGSGLVNIVVMEIDES